MSCGETTTVRCVHFFLDGRRVKNIARNTVAAVVGVEQFVRNTKYINYDNIFFCKYITTSYIVGIPTDCAVETEGKRCNKL